MKSEVDTEDMTQYREAINNLHIALQAEYDYTRRAIICVLRSHIIVRIDGLLKQEFAAVEKVVKTRKNILTDYDSHRAKCSLYERRGDSSNADRFRVKMEHDSAMLREHSEYLRKRFAELVAVGGALLRQETGLEVILWDERRTTIDAHNILFQNGQNAKKRKKTVDAVAAALMLEGYLTRRRLEAQK